MKKRYILGGFTALLALGFAMGPKADYPEFDGDIAAAQISLEAIDDYVANKDKAVKYLKPNNESRIIWADSVRKTPYSIVYLHGFSASPMEGDPVHRTFAKRYGSNLYIPRLAGHGLSDPESFLDLTPKALIESAKEAIAIGQVIGEKVILMSCSTGSTLSVYLAAENPELVEALIMYSPNIDLADPSSGILTMPWGLQIARQIVGEYRVIHPDTTTAKSQYTTCQYRTEGIVSLKALINETMTEQTFKQIKQPYLLAYYYKDDEACDHIVSIDAMKAFHEQSQTPADQKQMIPLPDVGTHVIPSGLHSEDIASVLGVSYTFAEEVLGLQAIPDTLNNF
jgi:pimeloyl-ACP methyl ester carboxylesterase